MRLRGSGFVVLGMWWPVAVIVGAGLVVMVAGQLRLGGQIMSGGFVLGGLVRLLRSPRGAGGLTARSRPVDVAILLLLGIGVLVASTTVNLSPDDPQRLPPPRAGTR